jgi:hypothetical protein
MGVRTYGEGGPRAPPSAIVHSRFQSDAQQRARRSVPGVRRTGPLARYALLWTGAAALVVLVALGAIRAFDRRGDSRGVVHAPPASVLAAARAAGCSFVRIDGPADRAPDSPPVVGEVRVRSALDGAYAQAPPVSSLVAALAHGRVVIQYRRPLTAHERALLDRLYDADRKAVILTPDRTGMDSAVSATAWRRELACPRIDTRVLEALGEFRDRFRGRGPE